MEDNLLFIIVTVLLGAFFILIIPNSFLPYIDTVLGRFILLVLPVITYNIVGAIPSILVLVVCGMILDRSHDIRIQSRSGSGSGSINLEYNQVIQDLSPNYLKSPHNSIVILDTPQRRLEEKYHIQ